MSEFSNAEIVERMFPQNEMNVYLTFVNIIQYEKGFFATWCPQTFSKSNAGRPKSVKTSKVVDDALIITPGANYSLSLRRVSLQLRIS